MNLSRFNAIDTILHRSEFDVDYVSSPAENIASFFGCNVFNDESMKSYLPEDAYLNVKAAIQSGSKLSREIADIVAEAMKKWAMDKGATHYAHWFQPWTGRTAEKHDSFFTIEDNKAIEKFGGKELAQQEPDGSSFPGGDLRSTFEARGYTAWDPSSPAFIIEIGEGKTLCIPTIFVTYGGDALDYKLPLLRSQAALEQAALPIAKWFDPAVTKITTTLGWEQEYFLIDEALYNARPDLMMTGRTIIGKHSPRGQQLEDHYFGSIPDRVFTYMRDLEIECHKLGIPVRTRHNEVAPAQYELAPMFEEVNVAVDHNQLLMDVMERVAKRHKLKVLFHEKPFAGVNGSGKHNNWSMATNTGKNLLSPGSDPAKNLRFLTFFVNAIMAVNEHPDLLRASIASMSNDHRLGANEAPPAIVSVYIGEGLTKILEQVEKEEVTVAEVTRVMDLISQIPNLEQDNTDRNRTSPFAFTGNKFEIRMAGSSMNCAAPMAVLNAMMAQQLVKFKNEVEAITAKGTERQVAIFSVLKDYITTTRKIRFEGDNYSDAWKEEAAKRGLNNYTTTTEALKAYISSDAKKLFKETGVFSERELNAHYKVLMESYNLKMDIESRTMEELCLNYVMPAAVEYQSILAENVSNLKAIGSDPMKVATYQMEMLGRLAEHMNKLHAAGKKMSVEREGAHHKANVTEVANAFCNKVKPLMEEIRECCDDLELIIDDKVWPLIKYRELMFLR